MSRRVNKRLARKRFIKSTANTRLSAKSGMKNAIQLFTKRSISPLRAVVLLAFTASSSLMMAQPVFAGSDNDGIVDVDEANSVVAEQAEQASNGLIITGVNGQGCSIGPVSNIGSVDPTMTTFMGLSMFMMAWRSIRRKVRILRKR